MAAYNSACPPEREDWPPAACRGKPRAPPSLPISTPRLSGIKKYQLPLFYNIRKAQRKNNCSLILTSTVRSIRAHPVPFTSYVLHFFFRTLLEKLIKLTPNNVLYIGTLARVMGLAKHLSNLSRERASRTRTACALPMSERMDLSELPWSHENARECPIRVPNRCLFFFCGYKKMSPVYQVGDTCFL